MGKFDVLFIYSINNLFIPLFIPFILLTIYYFFIIKFDYTYSFPFERLQNLFIMYIFSISAYIKKIKNKSVKDKKL